MMKREQPDVRVVLGADVGEERETGCVIFGGFRVRITRACDVGGFQIRGGRLPFRAGFFAVSREHRYVFFVRAYVLFEREPVPTT